MRTDGRPAGRGWQRIIPFSRFRKDRRGSVAIEFTALAVPFALLVFAILESCIAFAGQQLIANATDDIARQIRTGQAGFRAADLTETSLKQAICGRIGMLAGSDCMDNLVVDLREFTLFADAAKLRVKVNNGVLDTTGFTVKPGKSMTKNTLRVFYRWPVITDFMRKSMSNLADGKTLLFATATWQNEPFDD